MRSRLKISNSRIGIDILSLERFKKVADKVGLERISKRICSQLELDCQRQLKDPLAYLAGIWSCKEALYKALSFTGCKRDWKQVSLLKSESGAPYLKFKSRYKSAVSISHDHGVIVSTVILNRQRYCRSF